MNILQICNKSPYPPKEGGPIAMYNMANGLMDAHQQVHILAINTPKFYVDVDDLPVDYRYKTNFTTCYINTRVNKWDAFFNLFSSKSYHVQRYESLDFDNTLKNILQNYNYDIIQLETIYVGPYLDTIRKYSKAKIVLRAHNIENVIWSRYAQTLKNPLKKKYLQYLTKKLKKYEVDLFTRVDGIATITDVDSEYIKKINQTTPVETIPFGLNIERCRCVPDEKTLPDFFHIGSMDWMPNQEGIRWFLDKCYPLIEKEIPQVNIFLAGRNMPSWVYDYQTPQLKVVGEVEDATEFMQSHSVMIVPLLSGSGVRVKIIEGMALGRTIISTSIGAEGINYKNYENILIADTPEQFLEKFQFCINNPDKSRQIGKNARKLVEREHELSVTTQKLMNFYKSILS